MKLYTDLEQSKKLAEILPIESADACWTNHLFNFFLSYWRVESTPPQEYKALLDRFVVKGYLIEPCWSLATLLNVLKDYTLQTNTDGTVFVVCDSKKPMISDTYDNSVDACYELILKLKDRNLL